MSARSQLGCTFAVGKFWFFAGNAYKPMTDLRTLELDSQAWKHVNKDYEMGKFKERYAHTLCTYMGRYLFVFGGASQFFKATKRRETLSDLWVYDTLTPDGLWVQFKTSFSSEKPVCEEQDRREKIMSDAILDRAPS